jgi:DNA-binding transcriptional LysR family regulator
MEMFVRVVEGGFFSAAARDLNMGQPAVSKAITGLKNHCECYLWRLTITRREFAGRFLESL